MARGTEPLLPTGTVTLVFTDIEGSTALLGLLGDRYSDVLEQHRAVLRDELARCEGVEVGTEGDSFFVAFGRASGAVEWAIAAQRGLAEVVWPEGATVRVRVGMHTGQPTRVAGDYVGLDVHRAARIMAAAHGGQVVISQTTRDLVGDQLLEDANLRDLGEHRLKDLTHPQRLYEITISGLDQSFPPLRTLENRPTNLPTQASPLVGREREIAELVELLGSDRHPVITLTGPGGVGKTRLAMQAAAELVEDFRGGVYFVGLAAIDDAELVLPTVAQTIGAPNAHGPTATDQLQNHLADRDMVIVVDNFEQVLEAAPALAGVAGAAPRVRWLITSRASLRIAGEREYPVLPLTVPAEGAYYEDISRCGAVALFVERAQRVRPGFELTDKNSNAIAGICQALDGLPLAVELAAARVRMFPPDALLVRLDDRLKVLTGGLRDAPERQQTLRAAVGWSHALLSPHDQQLFARLGVFDGGWTFEAAEGIVGDEHIEVFDGLASLVENSLVRQDETAGGDARFTMLETIRAFAVEQLDRLDEHADIHDKHARYYQNLAKQVQLAWLSEESRRLGPALDADVANFRQAIEHLGDSGDYDAAAEMTGELGWYWQMSMHYELADRLVDRLAPHRSSMSERAGGLLQVTAGASALDMGRYDEAEAAFVDAVDLLEAAGEIETAAFAAKSIGWISMARQDPNTASVWFERASGLAQSVHADAVLFETEFGFADIATIQGDSARAAEHVSAGLALAERLGPHFLAYAMFDAAEVYLVDGRYDDALAVLHQARRYATDVQDQRILPSCRLSIATANLLRGDVVDASDELADLLPQIRERGNPMELGWTTLLTAQIAAHQGDADTAAILLGTSLACRRQTGSQLTSYEQRIHDTAEQFATTELGEQTYRTTFDLGTRMTPTEGLERADGCLRDTAAPPPIRRQ